MASRTVKQNGTADSVNASVVGASGARVDNASNAVTAVDIKGNAEFAVNDVNVKAINTYDKNGKFAYNGSGWSESGVDYNIQSGSGGVIDAPAVISKTVIDNEATVDFGANTVFTRNVARKEKGEDYQFAVSALNDVKATDKFAAEIYEFYRAGILTGSDAKGTFHADSTIRRSEVSAILNRMYDVSARQSIALK